MQTRLFLANLLYLSHVIFITIWIGLFLVPVSIFPDRITFHFYLTVVVVAHQFLWGLAIMPWTRKFRMVCILTTPMQLLRGQKIYDPKNYDHSFFQEFFGNQGLKIPHKISTLITFSALAIVTFQFLLLH